MYLKFIAGLLVVAGFVEPLLDGRQLVSVLGDAHRLVDVVEYPARRIERPLDGDRLVSVVGRDADRDLEQILEQQRILGQPLQRRRQQVLQLQPPARLVELGLRQQSVQILVLPPLLLERLERDLLPRTELGRMLAQIVAARAIEHGQQQVADVADERAVLDPSLLQVLLERRVQLLQHQQRRREQQIQVVRIQQARLLQRPHEDPLQQPQRSHVVPLRLVDFCGRNANSVDRSTADGDDYSPLMISCRFFSASDSVCRMSTPTFELQSGSRSPASSSLSTHSCGANVCPAGWPTASEDVLGLPKL